MQPAARSYTVSRPNRAIYKIRVAHHSEPQQNPRARVWFATFKEKSSEKFTKEGRRRRTRETHGRTRLSHASDSSLLSRLSWHSNRARLVRMPFLDSRVARPSEMGSNPLVARNGNGKTSPSQHLGGLHLADSPYISFSSNFLTSLSWMMIAQTRPGHRRAAQAIVLARRPQSAIVVDTPQLAVDCRIAAVIGQTRPAVWASRNREVLYHRSASLLGVEVHIHGASTLMHTLMRIASPTQYSEIDRTAKSLACSLGQKGLRLLLDTTLQSHNNPHIDTIIQMMITQVQAAFELPANWEGRSHFDLRDFDSSKPHGWEPTHGLCGKVNSNPRSTFFSDLNSICPHGRRKSCCKDCGGSSICPHRRQKGQCKECGGSSICPHGRQKSYCKDCGGSSICPHGRIKSGCKECGGSALCKRGSAQAKRNLDDDEQKDQCKDCGVRGASNKRAKTASEQSTYTKHVRPVVNAPPTVLLCELQCIFELSFNDLPARVTSSD